MAHVTVLLQTSCLLKRDAYPSLYSKAAVCHLIQLGFINLAIIKIKFIGAITGLPVKVSAPGMYNEVAVDGIYELSTGINPIAAGMMTVANRVLKSLDQVPVGLTVIINLVIGNIRGEF